MHGGLVGKWYTLTFNPSYASNTLLIASGQEKFVGCLNRNGRAGSPVRRPGGIAQLPVHLLGELQPSGALIAGGHAPDHG